MRLKTRYSHHANKVPREKGTTSQGFFPGGEKIVSYTYGEIRTVSLPVKESRNDCSNGDGCGCKHKRHVVYIGVLKEITYPGLPSKLVDHPS